MHECTHIHSFTHKQHARRHILLPASFGAKAATFIHTTTDTVSLSLSLSSSFRVSVELWWWRWRAVCIDCDCDTKLHPQREKGCASKTRPVSRRLLRHSHNISWSEHKLRDAASKHRLQEAHHCFFMNCIIKCLLSTDVKKVKQVFQKNVSVRTEELYQ